LRIALIGWVKGNWRLTFVFRDGHVFDLDFENYH
jgi:plasmid maintenance system killer protein